jgi:hypothetical protein
MRFTSFSSHLLTMLCLLSIIGAVPAAAQKRNYSADTVVNDPAPAVYAAPTGTTDIVPSATTPIEFPNQGNVTCADLNDSTDTRFAHITEDWEFKIDPPEEGTFTLDGTGGGELVGGMPPNSNMFLEVDLLNELTMDSFKVLYNSTSNITYLVSAVIIKGGNQGTNVYPYPSLSSGDTGPFTVTAGNNAISHISFCFEPFTAPTAAPASILGRVMDRYGRAIYGARVKLLDASSGSTSYTVTNTFGYYRFDGLPVGNFYELSVAHKRYLFANSSFSFTLEADLAGMDFIAF